MAVVTMAILMGMVTYLDRSCLGVLKTPISQDLDLSLHVWGMVVSQDWGLALVDMAFAFAYCSFGIPSARWAGWIGTRRMLTTVVVLWSLCTFATGLAGGFVSLVVARFLFGVGESGAWPAISQTLSRWIPYRERGTAQGVVWFGAHVTVGITPLILYQLMHGTSWHWVHVPALSWRRVFMLFSLPGLVWAAVWYYWFRDEPEQHRQVNDAELAYIVSDRTLSNAEEGPHGLTFWRRLLSNRNMIALCLMYLPNSFIFYFCITWFHRYLDEGRGLQGRTLAFLAGLPLLLSVAGDVLGGAATDWAVRHVGHRWGRAGVGLISYLCAGVSIILAGVAGDARAAALLFAVGNAANMFIMGAAWGSCQDIGGRHAGTVSATMNTAGQIGAIACPPLVVFLKDHYASHGIHILGYTIIGWNVALVFIGVSFLVASVTWLFIDPREKVFS
jgi:ACS family glucarate transporter-like MFS transporter